MAWLRPRDARDASEALAERAAGAAGSGAAVLFTGAAEPPAAARQALKAAGAEVVSTAAAGFGELVEYEPRDLVVTVGGGMRLDRLAHLLAERGQWLPVVETRPEASVGGLVAAGVPGPLDPTLGSLRRHLVACHTLTHDGRPLRWGRAVVKNVAGYDVQRLWCGSRGSLGLLTEASFRVWPRPAEDALFEIAGRGALELLAGFVELPAEESFRPDAVVASWEAGDPADRGSSGRFEVRLLGSPESVRERAAGMRRWALGQRAEVRDAMPPRSPETSQDPGPERGASLRNGAPPQRKVGGEAPGGRAVAYATTGRAALAETAGRLLTGLGSSLAKLDAYPLEGVLRCECRRGTDSRLALPRLLEAAAGAPVAVDRGGPEAHEWARGRRPPALLELERRVLEALGGRPRHWLAEHV